MVDGIDCSFLRQQGFICIIIYLVIVQWKITQFFTETESVWHYHHQHWNILHCQNPTTVLAGNRGLWYLCNLHHRWRSVKWIILNDTQITYLLNQNYQPPKNGVSTGIITLILCHGWSPVQTRNNITATVMRCYQFVSTFFFSFLKPTNIINRCICRGNR